MALRALVRKMPALGLRLSPVGRRMGPVRALSPAAGHRLLSHGDLSRFDMTINGLSLAGDSEDEIAELKKTINVLRVESEKVEAELEKCWAEREKWLEMTEQASAAAQASYNEAARHRTEACRSLMERFNKVDMACDVALFGCPVLIILMTITM